MCLTSSLLKIFLDVNCKQKTLKVSFVKPLTKIFHRKHQGVGIKISHSRKVTSFIVYYFLIKNLTSTPIKINWHLKAVTVTRFQPAF